MSNTQPRNFNGSIAKIRVSRAQNKDGIAVIEHKMPYGYAPPLHIHKNQDEVFHILRGRLRFEVGNESFVAQAGDILTAPKGVPHRFVVESPDGAHGLTITTGGDFESFVSEASSPVMIDFLTALPPPDEKAIAVMASAAARNHIEIIGPPLDLAA
jgi:mannose-6-phosphate isomerase-like protein (cupin superfamily)